ncbi:hypothetical protein [Neorhodopirellula lusitana]|uniref:hypothetical protein n=1 Tax=Neorhodopirellula lusitana TaxID=445327 RepID=UPI00384D76E3
MSGLNQPNHSDRPKRSGTLKKPMLYGLIGSVVLGVILGIVFVLRDTWGWFEVRVILTTLIVAAGSLCGLACDLSRTPLGSNWMPKLGMVLTALASALLLLGVWVEGDSEIYWKTTVCVSILAVSIIHVNLLGIATLAGRFRWLQFITSQIIFGFALLLCTMIIAEIDSSGALRLVTAGSIVIAALSMVIPILHRISRLDAHRRGEELLNVSEQRSVDSIDEEIARLHKRIADLERVRGTLGG